MKTINGIPVSPGIAQGTAFLRQNHRLKISRRKISKEDIKDELERYDDAVRAEIKEIDNVIDNYVSNDSEKELIASHKMILEDPVMREQITGHIENHHRTSEYALQLFLKSITASFAKMTNSYLAERISDYEDIVMRLINRLSGAGNGFIDELLNSGNNKDIILVLEDISPSDVAKSYHSTVKGICLSKGSKTSHSAIISRALGLPVIVGVNDIFNNVNDGDYLTIDGTTGRITVNPDTETFNLFNDMLQKQIETQKELEKIVDYPAVTTDGKQIQLYCNIELEQEVDTVLQINADGIGLFRTEYIFVDRKTLPTEEEQYKVYHNISQKMGEKPLIIRTYDLGGDKLADTIQTVKENNPFLGCRGIRLSLAHPEIFKTQIKAILRANENGNIMVMFPMVSSASEVIRAKQIIDRCRKELQDEKKEHNPDIKIGAMIEIPAVVFCIRELSSLCDFFSIGTNDLVQYTLAADRDNKKIQEYYNSRHPAVLKLIAITVINAHRHGKPVSICGEIASEPEFLDILLGLDIDSLSVNPSALLRIKKQLLTSNYAQAKEKVRSIIKNDK